MSIAQAAYSQATNPPDVPREAQEMISAAAETIRRDKITMEARSERIKMMRDQLAASQQALDLAIENGKLCNDVRKNQEAEIDFLTEQLQAEIKESKSEKRKKIFWKCTSAALLGLSLYALLL